LCFSQPLRYRLVPEVNTVVVIGSRMDKCKPAFNYLCLVNIYSIHLSDGDCFHHFLVDRVDYLHYSLKQDRVGYGYLLGDCDRVIDCSVDSDRVDFGLCYFNRSTLYPDRIVYNTVNEDLPTLAGSQQADKKKEECS